MILKRHLRLFTLLIPLFGIALRVSADMRDRNQMPFVGGSDFLEQLEKGKFVDKSFWLEQLFGSGYKVSVITRPRNWGKSLNLSMLYHLTGPFVGQLKLKIVNRESLRFAERPAIVLRFGDHSPADYKGVRRSLERVMCEAYRANEKLRTSIHLNENERAEFESFLGRCNLVSGIDSERLIGSLNSLIKWVNKDSRGDELKKRVILLVDQYDALLTKVCRTYERSVSLSLVKSFYHSALKDNPSLDLAVLFGVFQIPDLFSGLDGIVDDNLINPKYPRAFGFTIEEAVKLGLSEQRLSELGEGYHVGGVKIYDPKSVLAYLSNQSPDLPVLEQEPLVNALLSQGEKQDLAVLKQGGTITKLLNPKGDIKSLWSVLVSLGYVTVMDCDGNYACNLKVPTKAIAQLYP